MDEPWGLVTGSLPASRPSTGKPTQYTARLTKPNTLYSNCVQHVSLSQCHPHPSISFSNFETLFFVGCLGTAPSRI